MWIHKSQSWMNKHSIHWLTMVSMQSTFISTRGKKKKIDNGFSLEKKSTKLLGKTIKTTH
jgi:hypothetical protein